MKNYLTREVPKDNKPAKTMMPDIGIVEEVFQMTIGNNYSKNMMMTQTKQEKEVFHYSKLQKKVEAKDYGRLN